MDKHTDFNTLRNEFGRNKDIPARYEEDILTALSHYPELKRTSIRFELALSASSPCSTKPSIASCFLPKSQRSYIISILEVADDPECEALIKNLDHKMRTAVIGHALAHVLQYNNCYPVKLLHTFSLYVLGSYRQKLERGADKLTIDHGLGEELLRHAEYIRLIPGYTDRHPHIKTDYLTPEEIATYMSHRQVSAA